MLALHMLGPLALQRDGRELPLPVRKAAALLVLLALGGPALRPRVAAMLWPDLDEATGRRNLRRELVRLRDRGFEDAVQVEGDRLALAPQVELDTARFAAMLKRDDPAAALALWRGRPLDGLELDDAPPFTDWLTAERERLQTQWREAVDAAASAAEAHNDNAEALALLERLLADDPMQERHHRAVMRLHAAAGRREAALAQYRRCRTLLHDELGLAPMAETEALAEALRGAVSPGPGTVAVAHTGPAAAAALAPPAATPVPERPQVPHQLPFVGREREVAWLEQAWRSGSTVLIEGEGGVGKSRLALDFAAVRGPYAMARCRAGDGELPLSSFARVLRVLAGPEPDVQDLAPWVLPELARLLPELGPPPPPLRSAAERTRFGQACAQAWAAWTSGNFDTVLVDDWHLADPSSQALLAQVAEGAEGKKGDHLVHRAGGDARAETARLVLVYRPELAPAAAELLRCQREAGASHLQLQPLAGDAVFELVQRLSGSARPERFAALLSRATAGHPFYVAETLRHLVETGMLTAGADGQWQTPFDGRTQDYRELPLPASVREAVLGRVKRLPQDAQRVLEAAALAQEPFPAALLAPACALSEVEAALALEAALDAQLLREHDSGGFGFAHDLVQQALAADLSPPRRRSVHRRLALGASAAGAAPALVAAHHEAGGEPARAVAWRRRAADDAMRLLALDEAIVQWRQALADGAAPDDELDIRIGLMRALDLRARDTEAVAEAAALQARVEAGQGGPVQRAAALLAVAGVHAGRERPTLALEVLARLPTPLVPGQEVHAMRARAVALRTLGRLDESTVLLRAALAHPAVQPADRAELLDTLLVTCLHGGQRREALPLASQSLALARAGGDGIAEARALGRHGTMLHELGEHEAGEQALQAAADLCGRIGMVHLQRNCLFNLCALHSTCSRPHAVLRVAQEAWSLAPSMTLEPLRVQLALAFVEAHGALGQLGDAWRWAGRAIDDALALGQAVGFIAVAQTVAEVLAVLGEEGRGAPMLARLLPQARHELAGALVETWLIHIECALQVGDLEAARRCWKELQQTDTENPREMARLQMTSAALRLAEGDATAALAGLPAADAPGMNDELRWRTLAVRLQGEAALGGCLTDTLHAAEAALQHEGVHALAALVLHRALVQSAPTPARRQAWQVRVLTLAASLADEPALRLRFLQRCDGKPA
jgi:DNA-binding SARP family transcriptional activator